MRSDAHLCVAPPLFLAALPELDDVVVLFFFVQLTLRALSFRVHAPAFLLGLHVHDVLGGGGAVVRPLLLKPDWSEY